MFISISDSLLAMFKSLEMLLVVEKCLFAKSLIGATIQDGGTRERSGGD